MRVKVNRERGEGGKERMSKEMSEVREANPIAPTP